MSWLNLRATLENRRDDHPSAWSHRLPVIVLALTGCGLAVYLTLYQWHVIAGVWDPIFGSGSSEAVLTSIISRALPVPDATLGALAYGIEAMLAAVGGQDRWSTSPWTVMLFAAAAAGLALTSLTLVLFQIVFVRALCSLCLCSAAISLVNAWLAKDEAGAALGHLLRTQTERSCKQAPCKEPSQNRRKPL